MLDYNICIEFKNRAGEVFHSFQSEHTVSQSCIPTWDVVDVVHEKLKSLAEKMRLEFHFATVNFMYEGDVYEIHNVTLDLVNQHDPLSRT